MRELNHNSPALRRRIAHGYGIGHTNGDEPVLLRVASTGAEQPKALKVGAPGGAVWSQFQNQTVLGQRKHAVPRRTRLTDFRVALWSIGIHSFGAKFSGTHT